MSVNTSKFAIQRVFTIKLFDLATGENLGVLEDLKQSNFSVDGTTVYADGGAGNPHIIGFDHSKRAMLSLQNATFDFTAMGVQVGATPITGTNNKLTITDILTVGTNSAVTSYTALGTVGSEIKYVYVQNSDGTLGTRYTQAAVASTGKFAYAFATKTLTFFAGDLAAGTKIVVFYKATSGATTKTITGKSTLFAKNVKVIADGLVRDTCTGEDYGCQIVFDKAKASNKFAFTLTADGQPAIQNLDLEALKPCGSEDLFSIIIFDSAETV